MTDPHPVRWLRDVGVLLWSTSSAKRLRLGRGRRRVWGFAGFAGVGVCRGFVTADVLGKGLSCGAIATGYLKGVKPDKGHKCFILVRPLR